MADRQYGTAENFRACNERGIRSHMGDMLAPQQKKGRREGIFGYDDFTYDAETDTFTCPAGETLTRRKHKKTRKAYEFTGLADSDGDGIPDEWEWPYFSSLTNLTLNGDWDRDGFRDDWEYPAGTDPTNPASYLGIMAISNVPSGPVTGIVVRWQSASNKYYRLDRGTDLPAVPPFPDAVRSNIPAVPPVNTETDTTAVGRGPYFYRVGLE